MTMPLRPNTTLASQAVGITPGIVMPANQVYVRFGKRAFDIALVLLMMPFVVPLLAVVVIAMLILGQNPVFSQLRLGHDGRTFRIWKLRTMHPNADMLLQDLLTRDPVRRDEWDRTQKLKNDPRVTRFGAILRKTSIDELPQLWNVLRGDMSMIGPRPMLIEQAALYGPTLSTYYALRPGISGQWQVTERNDADFGRRAQIDASYASNISFATDMSIAFKTVKAVLRSTGH